MARIVRFAASRMSARSSGLFTIRSASKTAVASCMLDGGTGRGGEQRRRVVRGRALDADRFGPSERPGGEGHRIVVLVPGHDLGRRRRRGDDSRPRSSESREPPGRRPGGSARSAARCVRSRDWPTRRGWSTGSGRARRGRAPSRRPRVLPAGRERRPGREPGGSRRARRRRFGGPRARPCRARRRGRAGGGHPGAACHRHAARRIPCPPGVPRCARTARSLGARDGAASVRGTAALSLAAFRAVRSHGDVAIVGAPVGAPLAAAVGLVAAVRGRRRACVPGGSSCRGSFSGIGRSRHGARQREGNGGHSRVSTRLPSGGRWPSRGPG